ncbi:hypothetical protein MMC18_009516 [Xylographa bjoerkii]|nr:hypothetical protein [Xylographa bjoerkii]
MLPIEPIQLRTSTSPLQSNDSSPILNRKTILFRHPGYPPEFNQNVLLRLYAWDSPSGGLHAGTALLTCSLIACNAWSGYLTLERDGPELILGDDDILSAQEYYFHVPSPSAASSSSLGSGGYYKYPIFPSFQHWTFPHGHIPLRWVGSRDSDVELAPEEFNCPAVSAVSAAVIARDKGCTISKHRDYIERAHLCPRNELDWFQKNGMGQYNRRINTSGPVITDDTANAMAMRADIHRAFDDCKFAIVRKKGCWVTHFLETTYELGALYHNRPVEVMGGVAPEFILARYAWAILPLVKPFMEQGPSRLVKVREQCNDELQEVVKDLDSAGFSRIIDTPRGRSASPKKRKVSESRPPIAETKRRCRRADTPEDDLAENSLAEDDTAEDGSAKSDIAESDIASDQENEHRTLNLSYDTSVVSQSSTAEVVQNPHILEVLENPAVEAERLSLLCMRELRKRRPSNPALMCCDYNLAERADALGLPGKQEYGGGHLCDRCLGWYE